MSRSVIFPTPHFAPVAELAQHAEAAGFDMVWSTESRDRDGFLRLAPAAQATSRIRIGTGIAYAFTRHPLTTAAVGADLDELSDGRMTIGLGAGTKYMRKLWYQVEWDHPATQMKEYVEVMRAAWASASPPQPLAYHGQFYDFDLPSFARPNMARPRVPVYAAALNPAMLRAAAEAYDGIALFPLAIAKPYFDQVVVPNLEVGATRAGKMLRDVDVAAWVITVIDDDREAARRAAKHHIAFYLSTRQYGGVADLCGWEQEKRRIQEIYRQNPQSPDREAMADAVSEEMVDALAIAGTPDEARKQAEEFEARTGMLVLEGGANDMSPEDLISSCGRLMDVLGPQS